MHFIPNKPQSILIALRQSIWMHKENLSLQDAFRHSEILPLALLSWWNFCFVLPVQNTSELMLYVVIALLLACLPSFFFLSPFFFCPCISFLFLLHMFFQITFPFLFHFSFQSTLPSFSIYFLCRTYYQLCFLLTVPVPKPHLAQWRGDGAEQPGSDRFPGTAGATRVTSTTASPFAPPPLPFLTCSFFAINTFASSQFLCTSQHQRRLKSCRQVQPGSARAGAVTAMGLTLGDYRLSRLGTGHCRSFCLA